MSGKRYSQLKPQLNAVTFLRFRNLPFKYLRWAFSSCAIGARVYNFNRPLLSGATPCAL